MKTVLLLASFAGSLPAFAGSASKPVHSACSYTFSVDKRPVDGNYQRISLQKDENGTYTAKHRVITAGFGFPVSDTTEELGFNLDCVESKTGRILESLVCSHDNRPADGELIELSFVRNEDGTYNATLHRATYATLQGPGIDETNEIAYDLKYHR